MRCLSKLAILSSTRLFSALIYFFALSIIVLEMPILSEIANAFERPGVPIMSLKVGFKVSTSNSQPAFVTPSVLSAYS